jgi:hypothetical protein
VVVDVEGSESEPCSHDRTKVPGGVVDGSEESTMLRVSELGKQQGRSTVSDSNTESDKETSTDEHVEIHSSRLNNDTDDHEDAADKDTSATTEAIGEVGDDGKSDERTDGHDGVEQTQ